MANPLPKILIAYFDSVFEGPNGDYPAVLESLAGISAVQAAWKPARDCNSIWQIVDHLADSKLWQVDMLEKGQADAPVWGEAEGGTEDWLASLAHLNNTHVRLKEALGKLTEDSLFVIPDPEWGLTWLQLLLSIAAHEAHHAGQIDYLKGLQAGFIPE